MEKLVKIVAIDAMKVIKLEIQICKFCDNWIWIEWIEIATRIVKNTWPLATDVKFNISRKTYMKLPKLYERCWVLHD